MTAIEIIRQLEQLEPIELAEVRLWLDEQVEESSALLAAIDQGLRSLEDGKARFFDRTTLKNQVATWATGSR